MITFIAHFTVASENAAAFEELLDHVAAMSNGEPGVVLYQMMKSVDDADTYAVIEVYTDQAAVAAHGQTSWVVDSVPKFLGLIEGLPEIKQYVTPGVAPVDAQIDDLS